jgi:hypothetical protein
MAKKGTSRFTLGRFIVGSVKPLAKTEQRYLESDLSLSKLDSKPSSKCCVFLRLDS